MIRETLAAAGLAALAMAGSAGEAAAGDIKVSGKVIYFATPLSTLPLTGGKRLDRAHLKGMIIADDAASPINMNVQDCLGASLNPIAGAPEIESTGSCTASDGNGDVWSAWYNNKGDKRVWTVISGTGKFEGMTGGGTTRLLGATGDGRVVLSFDGMLQMK
jgi:hypothetical protein